jgi:hypothetical protein
MDQAGVHSIGNGKICAYIRGADIFDLMGPYYSTPSLLKLHCGEEGKIEPQRVSGTAIWDYSLDGRDSWRDFTVVNKPVFIRRMKSEKPVLWHLTPVTIHHLTHVPAPLLAGSPFVLGWYGFVGAGTFFYINQREKDGRPVQGYPITDRLFVIIAVSGDMKELSFSEHEAVFSISWGTIVFICGKDENAAWTLFEELAAGGIHDGAAGELCAETQDYWRRFTEERLRHFYAAHPGIDAVYERAADDIAVLLKTQQDDSGGILAGCNYHLAYVRDNYGCFRGLLSLGCLEEAGKLLRYYAGIHGSYGRVATAQGMGTYAFHNHEYDFAETTGCLVLMAMEYYIAAGDENFLQELAPLVRWALSEQRKHLTSGMLPFSGDETYIAGGVLPRAHIQDGSMEATAFYHRAIELFLPHAERLGLADSAFIREQKGAKEGIASTFVQNFIEDGVLYCNKGGLYNNQSAPKRRHGVMECGHGFGFAYRTETGRYVCIKCLGVNDLESVPPRRYSILSTALMPLWIGSSLVPRPILRSMVQDICRRWKETGRLPSRPDGDITVGYDYGLTLYAVSRILPDDKEIPESLRRSCLGIRDSAGAWTEYYKDGVPQGTPCRPWESAINIAALLATAGKPEKPPQ